MFLCIISIFVILIAPILVSRAFITNARELRYLHFPILIISVQETSNKDQGFWLPVLQILINTKQGTNG